MKPRNSTVVELVLAAAMLVGAVVGTVSAAESGGSPKENEKEKKAKNIPPEVSAILHDVADYYTDLDRMKMKANLRIRMRGAGLDRTMKQKMTLTVRKPNKLLLNIERGVLGGRATADGEFLYTFFPDQNAYLKEKAPEDFSGVAEIPPLVMLYSRTGAPPMLLSLLDPDPYGALVRRVKEASYAGAEKLHGHSCHHLQLSQDRFDWHLWIRKGDTPVVEKVKTNLTRAYQQASRGKKSLESLEAYSVMELSNWTADPELAKDTFQFTPPEEATEYSSLIDMLRSKRGESGGQSSQLLGKEAPDFTAPLLDGEKVTLSDHEGSDVVVLDFWATWCPPCKKAMPHLEAISEDYSDKSVTVYAVNQNEGKKKIRNFLEQRELSLTVVLDKQGQIARDYNVRGIPHTVLIGEQGNVQATHSGYNPNMEEVLSRQIDKLLAGENLVESTGQ